MAPSTSISTTVYLASQNQAAMTAYAQNVASPSSKLYHHYLTPAEYQAEFGADGPEFLG